MSSCPHYRFIHLVAMTACALLTSFCSSSAERSQRPAACEFAPAQTLGPIVNSPKEEGGPTVSADETKVFFTSGRNGQEDLFVSLRSDRESPWGEPANLGDSAHRKGAMAQSFVIGDFASSRLRGEIRKGYVSGVELQD